VVNLFTLMPRRKDGHGLCIFDLKRVDMAGIARRVRMILLHELLSRIHWDPEFGRGEFKIGYLDHVRHELVYVPLQEVHQEPDSHFCFDVTDEADVVHSVPYHRVKEVWKDGALIWRREH
jgi:uncharacterized protein (UPF0248 family)